MTCNTLDGSRNTPLLLVHRGCSLTPSPGRRLSIQALLRCVMGSLHWSLPLAYHSHLLSIVGGMRWIRGRSTLLVSGIHAIVYRWSLIMLLLLILAHLHRVSRLGSRLSLGSLGSLGSPLLANSLCLLLLLHAWRWRFSGRWRLEIHGWNKRLGKFLLCDEWM